MLKHFLLIFSLSLFLGCSESQPPTVATPDVSIYSRDDLKVTVLLMLQDVDRIKVEAHGELLLDTLPGEFFEPFLYLRNEFSRDRLIKDAEMHLKLLEHFDSSLPEFVVLWLPKVKSAQVSDDQLIIFVRFLRWYVWYTVERLHLGDDILQ